MPIPRPNPSGSASCGEGRLSALGTVAKSVDRGWAVEAARERRRDKRHAAELLQAHTLWPDGVRLGQRIAACGHVAHAETVELVADRAQSRAFFRGVVTCSSVWCCPVCSDRIAQERRAELNELLAWSRDKTRRYAAVMVTLTARHGRADRLADLLERLKRARQRWAQRRDYRELRSVIVGTVTSTEVTYGANGFHPHFHVVMLLDLPEPLALVEVERLRAGWLASLDAFGLTGNGAAFDVSGASRVGEYVAKFGAAEEMTLSGRKRGREGSQTPWQLLALSRSAPGTVAGRLAGFRWLEFAEAFRGRRQLVWSRGLAELAGIGLASDEAPESASVAPEVVMRWDGKSARWSCAQLRAGSLLEAAALGGDLVAAEFGPEDVERWPDPARERSFERRVRAARESLAW